MSDVTQQNKEEVEATAKSRGLIAFYPGTHEIFLDIDEGMKDPLVSVTEALNRGGFKIRALGRLVTVSQSGKGKHIYLHLSDFVNPLERIAIQAVLGSDPLKEALSLCRYRKQCEVPTVLFETPAWAKRVEQWRKKF